MTLTLTLSHDLEIAIRTVQTLSHLTEPSLVVYKDLDFDPCTLASSIIGLAPLELASPLPVLLVYSTPR